MPVYMIIDIQINDEALYRQYVQRVPEVIGKYGGKYLARGGQVTPWSGSWNPQRIVLIEFETMDHLRRCFESAEYRQIAPLGRQSTIGRAVVVQGCAPAA